MFLRLMLFFLLAGLPGFAAAAPVPPALKGTWEETWAERDGIRPEVYLLVRNCHRFMDEVQHIAALDREHDDDAEFRSWLTEQLATISEGRIKGYDPAVLDIFTLAQNGERGWMDWQWRHAVNTVYLRYLQFVQSAGSAEIALDDLNWWLESETSLDQAGLSKAFQKTLKSNRHFLLKIFLTTYEQVWEIPVATSPDGPAAKPLVESGPTPADGRTFDGEWRGDWGRMRLQQEGQRVTGTYNRNVGEIEGFIEEGILRGVWHEEPSHEPPDDAGQLEWRLEPDGNHITGRWRYGDSGEWREGWQGSRGDDSGLGGLLPFKS